MESVSDVLLLVVALGWDVEEDEVWLLDEVTFELGSLCRLKIKLFGFLLGSGCLPSLLLFGDLFCLFDVKLLDQWLLARAFSPCLHFEARIFILSVSLELDSVRQVRLIIAILVSVLVLLIDVKEVFSLPGHGVSLVLTIIVARGDPSRPRIGTLTVLIIDLFVSSFFIVVH